MCPKLLEVKRELYCSKCKTTTVQEANYNYSYLFDVIRGCSTQFCKGVPYPKNDEDNVDLANCIDFQEIIIQPTDND
jgi:hypothetical protein